MQIAPLPTNEVTRLRAVDELALLDTPPDPQFDDLALLASRICRTPIAAVSLMAAQRQWFKAKVGTDLCGTSRELSFCSHTILKPTLTVVVDARRDARFAGHPMVTGAPGLCFYAGMPLIDAQGHALGTICVLDVKPRPEGLTPEQADAMQALARQVVALMSLRRIAGENERLCRAAQSAATRREHDATHDALTGLPNRVLFTRRVDEVVRVAGQREPAGLNEAADAVESARRSAVLFMDLDGFKLINDSLGHAAGDELLRQVAFRLRAGVRVVEGRRRLHRGASAARACMPASTGAIDLVARLGGDEFTLLLRDLNEPFDANRVAERLLQELARPFLLEGHSVSIGGSIGIAHVDGRHADAADVMREADTAMYHAKLAGKGRHVSFDAAMRSQALSRLALENDLRAALGEGGRGLMLHYQPIVSLQSGATVGFEALVRWQHPTRGLLVPGQFIPLAEESNLIVRLGAWVADEACRQLAAWTVQDPRLAHLTLNVNVSRRQLVDPHFVPHLTATIAHAGIQAERLKLEITESAIMKEPTIAAAAMERLSALGVELHMDDFGTGHSSLSCLHRFPLDGLKIDRSFVQTMSERRDYAAIVNAVMNLARNLKMRVTAEGIETADQLQLLQLLDCDLGQGYYFARPMPPADAMARVIAEHDAATNVLTTPDETPAADAVSMSMPLVADYAAA